MTRACLVFVLLMGLSAGFLRAESWFVLVQEGQPRATIVIAEEATQSAQFAAHELQWHVARMTGATLPIVADNVETKGVRILVGESAATRAIGLKTADFQSREYMVRFLPYVLVLMGCDQEDRRLVRYQDEWKPGDDPWDAKQPELGPSYRTFPSLYDERGSLFAVYEFLERCGDVRWYRPGELGLVLPTIRTLQVKPADVRRVPAIRLIELGLGLEARSFDDNLGLWGSDPALNERYDAMAWADLRDRYVGTAYEERKLIEARRRAGFLHLHRMRAGGEAFACNHAFYGYYDRFWAKNPAKPEAFEGEHKEYFAQGYPGQPPQMCFTDPGFIQQVVRDARDYFDGKGTKVGAVAAGNSFGVAPMDNRSWCQCPRCQAELDQEEMKSKDWANGVASDYIFGFANQVAREIAKTHPGKFISIIAYAGNSRPPKRVVLAPNVVVQLCLHGRSVYSPIMQTDAKLLQGWAEQQVPLFLWLYYCYPQYSTRMGGNQGWHCFPGFFAHAAAREIRAYQAAGVRGVFMEGMAQDADEYIVLKLFDDPTLDVDTLLDEYFVRYYGAAAVPMKTLYLKIEQAYCSPANYPEGYGGHQTEEIAWGMLGTEERMQEFGALMDQARAAAATEIEKQRVAGFDLGIWQYMLLGRRHYLAAKALKATPLTAPGTILAPKLPAAVPGGDPANVDWSKAEAVSGWRTLWAEPCARTLEFRVAYDDTNLYVQLSDQVDPATLTCARSVKTAPWVGNYVRGFIGDYWRVYISRQNSTGRWPGPTANEGILIPCSGDPVFPSGRRARVVSDTASADRWTVRMAIPLKTLLTGGVEEGGRFYFNPVRHASDGETYSWRPMLGGLNNLSGLGAVLLDPPGALEPALAEDPPWVIEAVNQITTNAENVVAAELRMATGDAIQGKPFVMDTPKASAYAPGRRPPALRLSDARTPTSPAMDLFFQGSPEVAVHWELGPVPVEGRQLRQIALWRNAAEGARAAASVKFAVRDAATQAWRDVTGTILDNAASGLNVAPGNFRVLWLTIPEKSVTGFDAIRLTDGSVLAKLHSPRLVELDVFVAPER